MTAGIDDGLTNHGLLRRLSDTRPSILTKEREAELVEGMRRGDESHRRQLVLAHVPLAFNMALRAQAHGGNAHADVEDLFSVAMIGLLLATDSFDPTKSRFSTFGRLWIRSMLVADIDRRHASFSLPNHRKFMTVFRRMAYMRVRLGIFDRPLTARDAEAIAMEFRLSDPMEVAAIDRASNPDARMDVVDATGSEPWLIDADAEDPFEAVSDEQMRTRAARTLARAMKMLGPRERGIVKAIHLSEPPVKLRELAEREGVSYQRIQQISDNALDKLRRFVERMDPDLVVSSFPSRRRKAAVAFPVDDLHPEDRITASDMPGKSRERMLLRIGEFERWIDGGQNFKAAEHHAGLVDLSKMHFIKLARAWKTRRRIGDLGEGRGNGLPRMRRGKTSGGRNGHGILAEMVERGRILRERNPSRTESSIYHEVCYRHTRKYVHGWHLSSVTPEGKNDHDNHGRGPGRVTRHTLNDHGRLPHARDEALRR